MKLFALAATTAVDARSWSRVTHPAPGFINEQGGYWADQPTHPQAPQINEQVHQPYVQKPQCCEGYTWISPSGDHVWMRKSGEHHSKPYYTATDKSGVVQYLYWASISQFAPIFAKDGHWFLSTSLGAVTGELTKSKMSHGLRYCPQDYQSKPYTGNMNFECGQGPPQGHPQPPQPCCDTYKWTTKANNSVWMKKIRTHDGQNVYEGKDETTGVTKTIWFEFYQPGSLSGGGAWFVSDGGFQAYDGTHRQSATIQDNNQRNVCPGDDQAAFWDFYRKMSCEKFVARKCAEVTDTKLLTANLMPSGDTFTQCLVPNVVTNLVQQQIDEFLVLARGMGKTGLNGHLEDDVRQHMHKIHTAWRQMTNQLDKCGFNNDPLINQGQFGTVSDCTDMCKNIAPITSPVNMTLTLKSVLKDLIDLFLESFKLGNGGQPGYSDQFCVDQRRKFWEGLKPINDLLISEFSDEIDPTTWAKLQSTF